jgi:hypothetical protein
VNGRGLSALEGMQAECGNVGWAGPPTERSLLSGDHVKESGLSRARTQGGNGHAASPVFGPQRFAERQHEGFARAVDRHVRYGLEGSGGGDVDDATLLTGEHIGKHRVRQFDEGRDVERDLLVLTGER